MEKSWRTRACIRCHIGKTDVYNRAATLGFSEMILPGDRAQPGDVYVSRCRSMCRKMPRGGAGANGVSS